MTFDLDQLQAPTAVFARQRYRIENEKSVGGAVPRVWIAPQGTGSMHYFVLNEFPTQSAPCDGPNNGLERMQNALRALTGQLEDDEFAPTEFALDTARAMLDRIAADMQPGELPPGFVTSDEEGGVRFEWWQDVSRCVSIAIDAQSPEKCYAFIKLAHEDRGRTENIDSKQIAKRLRELSIVRP